MRIFYISRLPAAATLPEQYRLLHLQKPDHHALGGRKSYLKHDCLSRVLQLKNDTLSCTLGVTGGRWGSNEVPGVHIRVT